MTQPSAKAPMPHDSHDTNSGPANGCASHTRMPLTTLVATPSTRLPRVRYHAVDSAQTIHASVEPPMLTRASRMPIANTINGMPTKWVTMLRLSRWYSAYCDIRSSAGRNGVAAMAVSGARVACAGRRDDGVIVHLPARLAQRLRDGAFESARFARRRGVP